MSNKVTLFDNPIKKTPYALTEGDVMEHSQLGQVMFERWKRGMKSYVCVQLSTDKKYKVSADAFQAGGWMVIGNCQITKPIDKYADDSQNLVVGDLFLIERKNACEVFKFVSYGRTGKINACSPIDDTKQWSIDKGFSAIKIANL